MIVALFAYIIGLLITYIGLKIEWPKDDHFPTIIVTTAAILWPIIICAVALEPLIKRKEE